MSAQEYSGKIMAVEPTSSWVKVRLDTYPDKLFSWPMVDFVGKPRPEVGKLMICTARPGPHGELIVQQLIAIRDAPKSASKVEEVAKVETQVTTLITPPAGGIEELAERILTLKANWKERFAKDMLEFKWMVGQEISGYRGNQDAQTFRELEKQTGISHTELVQCVQFYAKYPKRDYELKAWRELRAELPAGKEPTAESKPALVFDETHIWKCPECGVKFQHLHGADGKHRLREVDAD